MTTITGFTAARMLEIENSTVVDGDVVGDNLILKTRDETEIDAGSVRGPQGEVGPPGLSGGLIPGEIKLWPGSELPLLASYGNWAWCDGSIFSEDDYPLAAAHIDSVWKTAHGQEDPGEGNFRAPDLRGLVPVGLDAMPGGDAAGRMTRDEATELAASSGEEAHELSSEELAAHTHETFIEGVTSVVGDHGHTYWEPAADFTFNAGAGAPTVVAGARTEQPTGNAGEHQHGFTVDGVTAETGINNAHENVQPSVFVPYIVKLDD